MHVLAGRQEGPSKRSEPCWRNPQELTASLARPCPRPSPRRTRIVCMTCSDACRSHHPSSTFGSQVQPLMHSTLARPMPCRQAGRHKGRQAVH